MLKNSSQPESPDRSDPLASSALALAAAVRPDPSELTRSHAKTIDRDWPTALRLAVRDLARLHAAVGLPAPPASAKDGMGLEFPVFVPWEYIKRMEYGNPQDPLLRQVLPVPEEQLQPPGFTRDAVGDSNASRGHGLLQKYRFRALIVANGTCAVHCRYCFRRHYPYFEAGPRHWDQTLDSIASDPQIEEIILSGGDPWTLTDDAIGGWMDRLAAIPHVRRVRFHTRLPILIPQRVTPNLLTALKSTRLSVIVVVHANHPQELCPETQHALRSLVQGGLPVLNQAVLLRGINDSLSGMHHLCRDLVDLGVMPYYLHQLDRVEGTAHFEVSIEHGRSLIQALRGLLPGYAVPRYVQEIPGQDSKHLLA